MFPFSVVARALRFGAGAIFFAVLTIACGSVQAQNARPAAPSLNAGDRVRMASKIYAAVLRYYPDLTPSFDTAYAAYVEKILRSDARRDFALASMELMATLGDGHTWFDDPWLEETAGGPIGFVAYPIAGAWTVVRSSRAALRPGNVITALDGIPIADAFARQRKYISASSDREAATMFFESGALFPKAFQLTFADGRKVTVDRHQRASSPPSDAEGRWLEQGAVAYLRLPSFRGLEVQGRAVGYLRQFQDAKTLVIDLRGNLGGGYPTTLIRALMDKPYRAWTLSVAAHGGDRIGPQGPSFPEYAVTTTREALIHPRDAIYRGRLILLIDRACASACEDFVMPFKTAQRATLIGEATAGTFSDTARTAFDHGMRINITAVRHAFPDGSRFEGVGIAPDLAVATSAEDLGASRDPVLARALEIAHRNGAERPK